MPSDPESIYLQLGQLIADMPLLDGGRYLSPEVNRWLARATVLVEQAGNPVDAAGIRLCANSMSGTGASGVQNVLAIVYRTLARAEAAAPTAARGGFVAVGAALDALQVVAQVLAVAKRDVLIVDAYMDIKVLTDFVPQAPAGVAVRLLADSFSTKPAALAPAATRFVQQFGSARPLDVRLSAPRALHDRLILVDGSQAWSLTQSLKDFAGRSPALVQKIDAGIAPLKVDHYEAVWASATPLPATP